MFCPVCRSEFRAGFAECADCGVSLVESLPPASSGQVEEPNLQLVTIFESGDPAMVALASSILESAQIPFMTAGESIQDLFGWGRVPGMMNVVTGPVQFKVPERDGEEARRLLSQLQASDDPSADDPVSVESPAEIRPEIPADHDAIERVIKAAFGGETEVLLVKLLRKHNTAVLSLVAVLDGEVVGHIMFSPITVAEAYGGFRGVGLAPIAVAPDFQRNGIGSRLIRKGVDDCRRAGYDMIVVMGDPQFYWRFGFVAAVDFGLSNEYGAGEEFMVLELRTGVLDRVTGLVQYSREFGDVGA